MNAERMVRARVICVSKAVAFKGALMMPHVDRCNRARIVENPGSIQSAVGDILRREGLACYRKTDGPTSLSPVASTGTEWGRCGTRWHSGRPVQDAPTLGPILLSVIWRNRLGPTVLGRRSGVGV